MPAMFNLLLYHEGERDAHHSCDDVYADLFKTSSPQLATNNSVECTE
jgi:hypothetical protein